MRPATYEDARTRIHEAARYGFMELDRVVRAAEVAQEIGYSPFHFQRLFRAMTGEAWAEYHRRLRLELAAGMVLAKELSSSAIAVRIGFESTETFIRAFRATFGSAPGEFRRTQTEHPILPSPNGIHEADPESVENFQPLARPGEPIEFQVKNMPAQNLAGIRYRGPLQFISQAWLELNEWAKRNGIDLNQRLLITGAEDLDEDAPPETQEAFVAIDDQGEDGLERFHLPEGRYLTARHVGSGHLLADFWLRLYAECIPMSGLTLRDAPAYQIYPSGLFVQNPDDFITDVYLPVEPN